jgi:hypothetical protein
MRVSAAPFKGTARQASVLVVTELAGRDLTLDRESRVEISLLGVDSFAKVRRVRNEALSLKLRPETRAQVEQSGVRLLHRLELPAGRYQLRVAVRDPANGKVGAIIHDLDVPDFLPGRVALSGLILTSATAAATMTPRGDDRLGDVLPSPPTAIRSFPQNDAVVVYAEVYDQPGQAPRGFDMTVAVLANDGRALFKATETLGSRDLQEAGDRFGYSARIPLSGLPPGAYVLSVEARSAAGSNATAVRQVQFTVTPRAGQ